MGPEHLHKNARLAIGDSGGRQDFIRTVRRRGFRFTGTVNVRKSHRPGFPTSALDNGIDLAGPTLSNKPSIAVLPFTNLSGDPEQEYFSDEIEATFDIEMGRWHEKEVGPHPRWSYQVKFGTHQFAELVPWLTTGLRSRFRSMNTVT